MSPALQPGDYVLATALPKFIGTPQIGWIVVMQRPDRPTLEIIKRVAEPTDTEEGNLNLTVYGDNPDFSTDSRHFGPIPKANLIGVVWLRYWPLARFGFLP